MPENGLVVSPRRVSETFGYVFRSVIRGRDGQVAGAIFMILDFGPIAKFLMDSGGLDETGEVLVGFDEGQSIRLILPSRRPSPVTEVTARDFPALSAAIAGQFGFTRTTDYRGLDVLVAFRPLGIGYSNWGLIAKVDTAEAYEPVDAAPPAAAGPGRRLPDAGARGLQRDRPAVRPADHAGWRGPRRPSPRATWRVRSEVTSSDEIGALGLAFNRMTEELERSYADLERRIAERTHDLEAVRDLLDAFFRISTSRMDPDNIDKTFDSVLRFCSAPGLRPGDDLAGGSRGGRDPGGARHAAAWPAWSS